MYKFDVTLEHRLSDCRYTSIFKELRGFSVKVRKSKDAKTSFLESANS